MEQRATAAAFGSTGPQGHRGRMRARLLAGPTALADYEILEMLLFLGIPRRDTKPQAKGLINRFGSFAATLLAGHGEIETAEGTRLPRRAAEVLQFVTEAARHLSAAERVERVMLGDWDALERHLDAPSRSLRPPGVSALLLNNRNQLLGECAFENDEASALTRTILREALERHATAAILVRNRGDGVPDPAEGDRALHRHVRRAAAAVSVELHDTIIIGQGCWTSVRRDGGP